MKKTILLFFISASSVLLYAQQKRDYTLFMDAARENSVLFRGELPVNYGSKTPNDWSTYFAFSTNFEQGTILFNGRLYEGIELNLNAHLDELYVKDRVGGVTRLVNRNFVDAFFLGSHHFIHYKQEPGSILISGYYEVLFMGNIKLFKKIRKVYFEEIVDRYRINKSYTLAEEFYLCKNDVWYRVGTKSDLKKIFPDQKRAIDHTVRTMGFDFSKKNRERALLGTVTYLNTL